MPPLRETPPEQRATVSPYIDQHLDNPVDWWEWGPDAFAAARERDVPIFLSVGYAACHWCHVMAHESFEDPGTARLLNDRFVSIKVDREERPDVDAVYMQATTALTGHGGWPMSVWLDHEGRVFHAGTYFPPEPRHGMPSFGQVLVAVSDAWTRRRPEVLASAGSIDQALAARQQPEAAGRVPVDEVIAGAVRDLAASFDQRDAGFGGAPKFPPSMVLEFLLRQHELSGEPESLELVGRTCEAMARGGIYDQLAGGFARYSVDASWRVPHFEKMLYDNALLLRAYTHAWCRTDDDLFRRVAGETADFLCRDLINEQGMFAAALDADSVPAGSPDAQPEEGAAYVWTPDQLDEVLGPDDGPWAAELFGVTIAGTFEPGTSTLTLPRDPQDHDRFRRVCAELLAARSRRPQPARDDKVVAAWNGLAITALVQAGVVFDEPRWVAAGAEAAHALLGRHRRGDRLLRVSRDGRPGAVSGMLDDYGNVIEALAWVFAATGDPAMIHAAESLTQVMIDRFSLPDGSFADTADDAEELVRRPQDPADNAYPGGTGSALMALVTLAALTGRADWRDRADAGLAAVNGLQATHPRFAGWSLAALVAAVAGPVQVAVVGESDDPDRAGLLRTAFREARAGTVVATGSGDETVALLAGRPLQRRATAYVCRDFACRLPVTREDELADQLEQLS